MPYNFNFDKQRKKIFFCKVIKLDKKINIGFFKNTLNRQGYVLMLYKKVCNKTINNFSTDDFLYKYLNKDQK